jgi:paraquat-inducible protein B
MFRPREPDLQSIDFVTRREQSRMSPVWLVPLAALLVGAWLAWTSWQARSPEVTITFPATEGLRAGATPILYRSVAVGEVRSLRLTPELDGVVVTASIAKELAPALTEGTRFELVQRSAGEPAVIVVEPGPKGPLGRAFVGSVAASPASPPISEPLPSEPARAVAAAAPVAQPTAPPAAGPEPAAGPPPGTAIVLIAAELGGLEPGRPIRLRGVPVGRIGAATLTNDGSSVRIEASVDQPFDALLREGVRLRRAGDGVVLEPAADSSAAPLNPGTELALVEPEPEPVPLPPAPAQPRPLPPVAAGEPETVGTPVEPPPPVRAIVMFPEPLAGLAVGSPVTLQGVPIGQVEALDLAWDAAASRLLTPVTLALDPARLRDATGLAAAEASELVTTLVERGLRVVRPGADDPTGPAVRLELLPEQPSVAPEARDGIAVLPWAAEPPPLPEPRPASAETSPAPAASTALDEPLAAIAADPALRDTLAQLTATLAATEAALAGPESQETLVAVRRAMGEVEQAGGALRAQLGPALGAIRGAAERLDAVLRDIRDIVRKDSVTRVQMNDTLKELASAARSVRIFADDLQRHPEALLRGKGGAYR